jgi:hypothetical protein
MRKTLEFVQVGPCAVEGCGEVVTHICETCGAALCLKHLQELAAVCPTGCGSNGADMFTPTLLGNIKQEFGGDLVL